MAYQTSMVKDLAIALEAMSRINHPAAAQSFEAIEELLAVAIAKTKKEFRRPDEDETTTNSSDDDIPF